MKNFKRLTAFFLSLVTALSVLILPVFSLSSGTKVNITKKTTVDTMAFNGVTVKAYYTNHFSGYESDMTSLGSNYGGYCCAGLVYQFYKRVYGVKVNNLFANRNTAGKGEGINYKKSALDGLYYNTPLSSSGYFYRVAKPQKGDIVAQNDHWSIVKSISSSGVITLLEQNYWCYPYTEATIKRQISEKDNDYWFFRFSGSAAATVIEDDSSEDDNTEMVAPIKYEIWTVCSDNGINVRLGPGTAYKVLTAINDGTIIHITDKKIANGLLWGKCELGWCAIEYADYVGGSCDKDTYTVEFYKNNSSATGYMSKMVTPTANPLVLSSNRFALKSQTFKGWNAYRESDRKWLYYNGKSYMWCYQRYQPFGYKKALIKNAAAICKYTTVNNDNIELYARWSKDKIKTSDLGYSFGKTAVYSGKTAKPAKTVFYGSHKLKYKTDYLITYTGAKSIGPASVKITLIGSYSGTIKANYTVLPKAVTGLKLKKSTYTTITLKWNNITSSKGYIIYRKNNSTGKYTKLKTLTKNNLVTFKDSNLKRKTSYMYAVRSYKKVNGKYYCSSYKYLSAKTK